MPAAGDAPPASLIVIDPAGHRSRVAIRPLPFRIGRQAGSELIIRDSRASRSHARIVTEGADYVVEDAGSRHGVWVNGQRVARRVLRNSDRIEFGVQESYRLVFGFDGAELARLMEQAAAQEKATVGPGMAGSGPGTSLGRLRAVLEVARTLERGFSLDDVLKSVVDAALAVTGAERGFLLLRREDGELEMRVARSRSGGRLEESDLRIPRRVIRRALDERRDLFSVNLDPAAGRGADQSMADLELRSCVCVPLLRISTAAPEDTSVFAAGAETAGVLYLDSTAAADLAGGNRELLQSLAIEVSTVLENARLLEEERAKQRMEEELDVARGIQQSLLPRMLPEDGWFRACGASEPSHQVGGDYYDVVRAGEDVWVAVVADVSGKGVSSALLASLLQGAFLATLHHWEEMPERMGGINRFLNLRTAGEKYATVFYCTLARDGELHYVNAGHCAPLLVRASGALERLEATGMPVGLVEPAEFGAARAMLGRGDKLVIYSDGVTEAQNAAGEFFGRKRLRETVAGKASAACRELFEAIQGAVAAFTGGAAQSDDLTLVVLEYAPE